MTEWRLKKSDGSIYGPVSAKDLKAWAADGRIEPGDTVSPDNQTWSPADQQSDLMMDWTAELADGRMFGPLPAAALLGLLADGSITSRSRILHRQSGESTTLESLLGSAASASDTQREVHHWQRRYEEAVKTTEARLSEHEKMQQDRIQLLEAEVQKERTLTEEARARVQAVEEQHREIVGLFRDLSDRYIRLRDQTRGAPSE